jgi:kynureninase
MPAGHDSAAELDAVDPLHAFLDRFAPVPPGLIYLDGNSLGRLPTATTAALHQLVTHEWGERLIRGWDEGWMELPRRIGDRLGEHLLGAAGGQILLADSTTVCFYKLAAAALAARPDRPHIITDAGNFPTDRYVLEGLAQQYDRTIVWTDLADAPEAIDEQTALVAFSHVDYRSAAIADMRGLTQAAHAHGALVRCDLSHSVGVLPIHLDADEVDLAVGCTYKYLNGGPGSQAFLYVNHRHHDTLSQPIWGWLGRADPFAMAPGYVPGPGIARLLSGTPPILGLVAAQQGIELVIEAGIERIREKSIALTAFAIATATAMATPALGVGSPRAPALRGSHVALTHPDAQELTRRLADHDVIVDFRAPDVIRLGLSPLTTRFADIDRALHILHSVSGTAKRDNSPASPKRVTDSIAPSRTEITNRPDASQRPSTSR